MFLLADATPLTTHNTPRSQAIGIGPYHVLLRCGAVLATGKVALALESCAQVHHWPMNTRTHEHMNHWFQGAMPIQLALKGFPTEERQNT